MSKQPFDIATFPRTVVRSGTIVYHGTDALGDFSIPRGPAWFAPDYATADKWIGWASASADPTSLGHKRVLTFEILRDISLLDLDALSALCGRKATDIDEGWARFCEMITGQNYEVGVGWVAREMSPMLIGWYSDSELMLVQPERWLKPR